MTSNVLPEIWSNKKSDENFDRKHSKCRSVDSNTLKPYQSRLCSKESYIYVFFLNLSKFQINQADDCYF